MDVLKLIRSLWRAQPTKALQAVAYDRFIASMIIGPEEWRDGTPYDCAALLEVSESERTELEDLLIGKKHDDWRVSEALAFLQTPRALEALEESSKGPNRNVRLWASERLNAIGRLDDLDEVIVDALRHSSLVDGLAFAERLAAQYPSPAVEAALLEGALCSRDGRAVRFAGILFFLHGKAAEPFDWSFRPFFLRFNTLDPIERRAAFDELCERIGVEGSAVMCPQ